MTDKNNKDSGTTRFAREKLGEAGPTQKSLRHNAERLPPDQGGLVAHEVSDFADRSIFTLRDIDLVRGFPIDATRVFPEDRRIPERLPGGKQAIEQIRHEDRGDIIIDPRNVIYANPK